MDKKTMAIEKRFKLLKNGKYKSIQRKQILFNKSIEVIFETHSKAIKKAKRE